MREKLKSFKTRLMKNKIIKNYIWVFFGQNVGAIFSMLSLIFTLRIISTYDYGSLVIIQTYCLLISGLFSLRTFNGVIKFVTDAEISNDPVKMNRYVNTGFLLDFLAGTISVIFGILLLKPITLLMGWDTDTVKYVGMYLPAVFFYPLLHGTSTGTMRKLGFFKHVNIIHAVVYGLQTIFLLLTWLFRFGSFRIVILEYAIIEILECIILVFYSIRILQRNAVYHNFWEKGIILEGAFIKYNIYYGLISTFDQLLGNISTLLINKYIGNFATAYIKVITRICSMFTKITNPISQVFYPELCEWIAKKKYKKAFDVSIKYFYIVAGGGVALVVLLTITFDLWIRIFDSSMASAKYQSMLYMIYTLLSVSIICINQLTLALDLVKQSLIIVIIFDFVYIAALIPSIRMFDIYGYLILQIAQLMFVVGFKMLFIRKRMRSLEEKERLIV